MFVQLIETILPVEHYCELSGVMCDCAILLPFIKNMVPQVCDHLATLGFELTLNNLLYKWFVSIFMQGMNEEIWLPIWDLLFLDGYIVLFKAAIAILILAKDQILKLDNILDINNFFEEEIINFKDEHFIDYLINLKFTFDIGYILEKREINLPKVIENIKQTSDYKLKQYEKKEKLECNLDWPVCLDSLRHFSIIHSMVFKALTLPKVVDDFYEVKNSTYLKIKEQKEKDAKKLKEMESLEDEKKKKTIIFGDLLIERQIHQCGTSFSSRKEILEENPLTGSIVMFDERSPSMRVINSIIEEKRGFNYSKIIESVDKSNIKLNQNDQIIRESIVVFDNGDEIEDFGVNNKDKFSPLI